MKTVLTAAFDVLRQLGMTTIFGNPGSTEETFLKDFPADFRYVLALQEANAVAMADGYAQATGQAAFVNLHTAAGLGNAMGNIESAFLNRSPLVITAGQQTREMLLLEPYLTNSSPTMLPLPYVKWSYEPARAEDVPAALLRAYATAVQPPAGPVFLSIPMDDLEKPCARPPVARTVSHRLSAGQDVLAPVAERLRVARAPVLILGGGVDRSGGWDAGVALAERLRAPVWAPPLEGRPGFPETHPLYRGTLPGAIGPLAAALAGHDLAIVIGAPVFRYYPYVEGDYLPRGMSLVHITDDPEEAARAPVGDAILADPAGACRTLATLLPHTGHSIPQVRSVPHTPEPAEDGLISPDLLYHTIERMRPTDSIIVQESMSTLRTLKARLPTAASRSFFSMTSGVLGFAVPGAVGIALAQRDMGTDRKVVCIVGDGAAQYVIQSIWSAVQHRLPVLFVVARNHQYGILKSFATQLDTPGVPGLDLPGIDCVSLANGYGCEGAHVGHATDLERVLRDALGRSSPYLVQVEVDRLVPPLL